MFAPRPLDVAKEMVCVTKPKGRIVMGNWIPGDPTLVAQILKISANYTPAPPAGFISPVLWGIEQEVSDRFGAAGIHPKNISFAKETFMFNAAYPRAKFVQVIKNYYGPTMNAFDAAAKNGKAHLLEAELEQLFESQNASADKTKTSIPATFLKVVVER